MLPPAASIAVAGPIIDGQVRFTKRGVSCLARNGDPGRAVVLATEGGAAAFVKSIPTQLIVNPDAALLGAACAARQKAVKTSRIASLAVQFAIPNPYVHIDLGVAAEFLP